MEEAGISPKRLVHALKDGLEATKLYGKQLVTHPDYKTRFNYLIVAFKLLGIETEKPNITTHSIVEINKDENIELLNNRFVDFLYKYYGSKVGKDRIFEAE